MTILYSVLMFILFILFIVDYFKHRKEVVGYKKYGYFTGLVFILFELLIVIVNNDILQNMPILQIVILDSIAFLKIVLFTLIGIYYSSKLGYPNFPIISAIFGSKDFYKKYKWNKYIFWILGAAIVSVVYSFILFKITSPEVPEAIKSITDNQMIKPNLIMFLFGLESAFVEEINFRLVMQNFFAEKFKLLRNNYWIAISITSFIWALGHVNALDPQWVKFAQIFPIGIVLGLLYKKYGTESSILAHGSFNIIMIFLAQYLIGY